MIESVAPTEIRRGITTTGALGETIRERGVVRTGREGAVLVTGCAHPGLSNLAAARELEDITGVIGGFHGFDRLDALEDLEFISPCHCTRRKREIEARFPDEYVRCGAG